MKKLYIKTHGCQMNFYDSEKMVDLLKPLGYELHNDGDDAGVEVVVVMVDRLMMTRIAMRMALVSGVVPVVAMLMASSVMMMMMMMVFMHVLMVVAMVVVAMLIMMMVLRMVLLKIVMMMMAAA